MNTIIKINDLLNFWKKYQSKRG